MKITKRPGEKSKREMLRIQANRGCDVCPVCGETKPYSMDESGKMTGILTGIVETRYTGFLLLNSSYVDKYSCLTCGAEWESDPYPIY